MIINAKRGKLKLGGERPSFGVLVFGACLSDFTDGVKQGSLKLQALITDATGYIGGSANIPSSGLQKETNIYQIFGATFF